ncbi:MFS transporter [Sphaerothrix gracilis]|uniref:MFS transporter n=1 Tax=Sphaerothrix gracilis TaxID=3151835 RepID=UPI0031FDF9FE
MLKRDFLGLPLQFWVVALVAFINAVSFTIIIPIIYPYAKQFGLSDFQASLLTTAYAAAQFIGTPILGSLSDRLGRKPLLILSLLGTVAASLVAAFAGVAWLLFAARILDGLTGGNTSIARAIISDTTTPERRTKAFGIFGATFRLGFVAGPPLSYLAQTVPPLPGMTSLGMSFLVGGAIAAIATLLCLFVLPETLKDKEAGKLQLRWRDFGIVKVLRSLQRPQFGRIFVLTFFSGFTFTIFTFAFQPFFLNVLNQDAKALAIVFAAIGVVGFVTQVFALNPLKTRLGLITLLAGSLAVRGVLFLAIPTFPGIAAFGLIALLFGAVNSFPMPIIDSILSLRSGDREQGEVLGINSSYLSMSNAIGPAVAGLLVTTLGYKAPFWITGVLTLLTAGFALTIHCPQPQKAKAK